MIGVLLLLEVIEMVIKSIEEIKEDGLRIDEFKEMSLYQTKSNHFVLFVKEHTYPFNSVDMAQKTFEIVKRLWFDDEYNTEKDKNDDVYCLM